MSASMRTALLVYSGITVKMMIDSDLGAQLSTMFMVQYEPTGLIGGHDHPFEETYLILDGAVEATFDGASYVLGPGDVGWAGVGCVHSFRPAGDGPVRWLETQAPQPPGPALLPLRPGLGLSPAATRDGRDSMITVVVGGTSGLGLEIARHYAASRATTSSSPVEIRRRPRRWRRPWVATPGHWRSTSPSRRRIAPALAGIERVDNLVLAAIDRDYQQRPRVRPRPGAEPRDAQARRIHRGRARAAAGDARRQRSWSSSAVGPRTGRIRARPRSRRSTVASSAW